MMTSGNKKPTREKRSKPQFCTYLKDYKAPATVLPMYVLWYIYGGKIKDVLLSKKQFKCKAAKKKKKTKTAKASLEIP